MPSRRSTDSPFQQFASATKVFVLGASCFAAGAFTQMRNLADFTSAMSAFLGGSATCAMLYMGLSKYAIESLRANYDTQIADLERRVEAQRIDSERRIDELSQKVSHLEQNNEALQNALTAAQQRAAN